MRTTFRSHGFLIVLNNLLKSRKIVYFRQISQEYVLVNVVTSAEPQAMWAHQLQSTHPIQSSPFYEFW